jgi:hypothetical protein
MLSVFGFLHSMREILHTVTREDVDEINVIHAS